MAGSRDRRYGMSLDREHARRIAAHPTQTIEIQRACHLRDSAGGEGRAAWEGEIDVPQSRGSSCTSYPGAAMPSSGRLPNPPFAARDPLRAEFPGSAGWRKRPLPCPGSVPRTVPPTQRSVARAEEEGHQPNTNKKHDPLPRAVSP
jgi:hypothetical protein